MLKHVQLSPYRTRAADSLNLSSRSTDSLRTHLQGSMRSHQDSLKKREQFLDTLSLSSTTSPSPEPPSSLLSSRSSSYSSLSDASVMHSNPTTTIKVYAKCLRSDIEYKTLGITYQTTCREVVTSLLNKYRMRHRDPNLYYLTMEVTVRKAGVRTVLALDEEARPAALQSCHPRGDSKFALQMRRGGLVKIYDSILMPGSQYKSLLISERTTVDELIQILLNCYNSCERVEQFSLYEVCEDQEYQRKLHPDDCPLQLQHTWLRDLNFHFLIKRNSDYRLNKSPWSSGESSRGPCGPCAPRAPCAPCSSKSMRNETRASFSTSSLSSSSSSGSSSEENTNRFSCCSDYDNYFYI